MADNFANKMVLNGLAASDSGSNMESTKEVGEPNQQGIINSEWWSWTAPNSGTFTIDTKNSDFDTYLSVFTGSALNNLTLKGSNDDAEGLGTSVVNLPNVTAGTTYQIAVDGVGSEKGNIELNIVPVVIYGSSEEDDTLTGTIHSETIYGLEGNDRLFGRAGNDTLYGDDGSDYLDGGPGADRLIGGPTNAPYANNAYVVDNVGDVVIELGNSQNDGVISSINYTLPPRIEHLKLIGAKDAKINGNGNELSNTITGTSNNNVLTGWSGNDNLNGLDGDDTLIGGYGNDILTGGTGRDEFVFKELPSVGGVDRITDLNVSSSDKIVLSKSVFSSLETYVETPEGMYEGRTLETQDFSTINVDALSEAAWADTSPNEIVYNVVTGNLFYNPNNTSFGFGSGGGKFATIDTFRDYFYFGNIVVIS